ncbi:MAG: TetR/AcrR family transcriptional regulator [Alphaproteobacteria bacterium]|nr:TetR/AcrR family transcriptional regulator [Alphaproteobacteria bacterium]
MESSPQPGEPEAPTQRQRIVQAAMELFMARGYAATSTLAIATAAKVSKRDLYAAFSTKQAILAACVRQRAGAMQAPLLLERPANKPELIAILERYGAGLRIGVTDPKVIAAYRLAIQEAPYNPELAQTLREEGRMAAFNAVAALLREAQSAGVLRPGPVEPMAGLYLALLIGDLVLEHLLGYTEAGGEEQARHFSEHATRALIAFHGT